MLAENTLQKFFASSLHPCGVFFMGQPLRQQQGSQTAQVLGCLQRIDAVK